jgi:anion-transporting  ArsA/GET3 family ATPase
MSIADGLADCRTVICAGSGGTGKTTMAAALALGLAERGRRVGVVTIDPARRLAGALGLARLGNEPRRVETGGRRGELWAMMLDHKRTFDELVGRLAPDAAARDAILANRVYRELSSAVAGSQEFGAVAELYELDRSGRFDALVLDTPPSRNALDFLDAPQRLAAFLDGRLFKALGAPAGVAAGGSALVLGVLRRLTGMELLDDLRVFFLTLGGVLDGLAERATAVHRLLLDPATAFVVVASPEPVPVEEAIFLARRLDAASMRVGALVVNRVRPLGTAAAPAPSTLAAALEGDAALAARALRALADVRDLARRDAAGLARLEAAVGRAPLVVPQLDDDVHDLDGLRAVARHLFAGADEHAALVAAAAF